MSMKHINEIKRIMNTIPNEWRKRWCGGEDGPCACAGCVQIGNRIIMYEKTTGRKFLGDPEYISEESVTHAVYERYKISKDEWQLWMGAEDNRGDE